MDPRLDDLIERYLAGIESPEEAETLERRVAEDPAVARAFLAASRRDVALRKALQARGAVVRRAPRAARSGRRWLPWGIAAAAAAAAMLVLLRSPEPSPEPTRPVSRSTPLSPVPPRPPDRADRAPIPAAPEEKPPAAPPVAPAAPETVPSSPPASDRPAEPPPARVAPARVPPPPATVAAVAELTFVRGEAAILSDGVSRPARPGTVLRPGEGVRTGPGSAARITLPDGSVAELEGETVVERISDGPRKEIRLAGGVLVARVKPQAAGSGVVLATPQAEIAVLGTELRVSARPSETGVAVLEGRVRVTGAGGRAVTVAAGQFALAPAGGPPTVYRAPAAPARLAGGALRAVYYDRNTKGGASLERREPGIDLLLEEGSPELPPVGQDRDFAAVWDGWFLAEREGDYVFLLWVDGRVKLTVGGQDLVAEPEGFFHGRQSYALRKSLKPGWHEIRVEYSDDAGASLCRLRYLPPGTPVPADLDRDDAGLAIPPSLWAAPVRR
jgi:ferric-dicitrate binding protein FerR (iron transport regulator)